MLGTACHQGSPGWGTVVGISVLGSPQDRVPSCAEVSSAHVLLSFCLEICAIKATILSQGLCVVRHERVHLNKLHFLNGVWGVFAYGCNN